MARNAEPDPVDRCMPTPSRIAAGLARRIPTSEVDDVCRRGHRSRPRLVRVSTVRPRPCTHRRRWCGPRGIRHLRAPREDHVGHCEGECAVGPRVRTEVEIGVARRAAAVRIHHHQFGTVLLAGPANQFPRVDRGRDGIHSPDHDHLRVRQVLRVRPRPTGDARRARTIAVHRSIARAGSHRAG